jgi:hypothetical protein
MQEAARVMCGPRGFECWCTVLRAACSRRLVGSVWIILLGLVELSPVWGSALIIWGLCLLGRRSSQWSQMTRPDSSMEYRAHIPARQANKALTKDLCSRRRESDSPIRSEPIQSVRPYDLNRSQKRWATHLSDRATIGPH